MPVPAEPIAVFKTRDLRDISKGVTSDGRVRMPAMALTRSPDHPTDAASNAPEARGSAIGYARVSTTEQDPSLQFDALQAVGCERVFTDHASGTVAERPELSRALDYLRPGDVLIVWRLDRLGRSVKHLIDTIRELGQRGVGFRSLTESLDTTTPGGRLLLHLLASFAEFEADLIRERTAAGLAAARAHGRRGGRPRLMTPDRVRIAKELYAGREHTVEAIAAAIGVSRATVYRALASPRPAASSHAEAN
jgi:DNA invertase Pin-like site-specific DNA recombinase